MVKHLPTVWEIWVVILGQADFLEKGMATHSQYSCLKNFMDREAWSLQSVGSRELDTTERLTLSLSKGLIGLWVLSELFSTSRSFEHYLKLKFQSQLIYSSRVHKQYAS